jgi:hypothetical protein
MYFYQIKCCFYTQNEICTTTDKTSTAATESPPLLLAKWLKWLNVPIQNKVFLSYLFSKHFVVIG